MRELQTAFRFLSAAFSVVWWFVTTAWLGVMTLWRIGVLCSRSRQIFAEVRPCPRGHEVPMYGLFDCGCGARIESWIFAPCPICHESAGYTPCPSCGLPVRNPLLP